jgi:hypothetical protein
MIYFDFLRRHLGLAVSVYGRRRWSIPTNINQFPLDSKLFPLFALWKFHPVSMLVLFRRCAHGNSHFINHDLFKRFVAECKSWVIIGLFPYFFFIFFSFFNFFRLPKNIYLNIMLIAIANAITNANSEGPVEGSLRPKAAMGVSLAHRLFRLY